MKYKIFKEMYHNTPLFILAKIGYYFSQHSLAEIKDMDIPEPGCTESPTKYIFFSFFIFA